MRRFKLTWLVLVTVLGVALYQVKYKVMELEQQQIALHHQINQEQETVQVLKAELAYLSRPDILLSSAEKLLDLQELKAEQIAGFQDLPFGDDIQMANEKDHSFIPANVQR